MSNAAMRSRINAVVACSWKANSGRRWMARRVSTISSKTPSTEAGLMGRVTVRPSAQRLRRSRAMWVTWISSVPA